MGVAVAGVWGFAEATLFFLVPDIWLTGLAVARGLRSAVISCGAALVGALAGGIVMYHWGAMDPAGALAAVDAVPAISPAMLTDVRQGLEQQGIVALFLGPLVGIPYKAYAVQVAGAGIGTGPFLTASVGARLTRFVVLAVVAAGISRLLEGFIARRARLHLLLAAWTLFYAVYFAIMPN